MGHNLYVHSLVAKKHGAKADYACVRKYSFTTYVHKYVATYAYT